MPFGLRNAPRTFQRFMHEVLFGLPDCFVYMDDILIASRTPQEHLLHLELKLVLEILNSFGLRISLSKSMFSASEVMFPGNLISGDGIRPDPERVKTIMEFKRPTTVQEFRRFLGVINFYRRHIPHGAEN